jgi:hypothetical protein
MIASWFRRQERSIGGRASSARPEGEAECICPIGEDIYESLSDASGPTRPGALGPSSLTYALFCTTLTRPPVINKTIVYADSSDPGPRAHNDCARS